LLPASDGGLAEAIAAVLKAGGAANGRAAKGCIELGAMGVNGADADTTANGRGARGKMVSVSWVQMQMRLRTSCISGWVQAGVG